MERNGNVNVTPIGDISNVNVNEWVERQKQRARKRSQENLAAAKRLQKALGASEKD